MVNDCVIHGKNNTGNYYDVSIGEECVTHVENKATYFDSSVGENPPIASEMSVKALRGGDWGWDVVTKGGAEDTEGGIGGEGPNDGNGVAPL